jgi:hypothetical protein
VKAVSDRDHKTTSTSKKKQEKISLLKNQINIWKKVLKRKITIPFTHSRSKRPVDVIVQELAAYIDTSELPSIVTSIAREPTSLIGKHVEHKFEHEDTREAEWYSGCIVGYDPSTNLFEIVYDGEEDTCNFDIILDLILGDLVII